MKRKNALRTLSTILMSFFLFGCNSNSEPSTPKKPEEDPPKEYIANVKHEELSLDTNVSFTLGKKTLLENDDMVFSTNLAKMFSVINMDLEDEGIAITKDVYNTDPKNNDAFLLSLGFSDITKYELAEDKQVDTDDKVGTYFYQMPLSDEVTAVCISLLGSEGGEEWGSNFDVGNSTSEYASIMGNTPEWDDKDNHKGFDVTANRIKEKIEDYLYNISIADKEIKFFISGYSRGAAIANILGAKLEDKSLNITNDYSSYTICLACPNTTEDLKASSYQTIFNVINEDDIFTNLLKNTMSMKRYGTDHSLKISTSSTLLTEWKDMTGLTTYNSNDNDAILAELDAVTGSRNDFYTPDQSDNARIEETSSSIVSLNAKKIEVTATLTSTQLIKYAYISDNYVNQKEQNAFYYCLAPSFIREVFKKTFEDLIDGNVLVLLPYYKFFSCPKYQNLLSTFVSAKMDEMANCHATPAYFVILNNL